MAENSRENVTIRSASSSPELRFRAAWAAGERPSMATYLRDVVPSEFARCLLALVKVDWAERVQRGETPRREDYAASFPEYAGVLRDADLRPEESVDRGFSSTVSLDSSAREDSSTGLAIGDQLGRFVLESRLGRGGFGEVWRAHDPVLGRPVALKVLRPDRVQVEGLQDSLLHEARKIAQLSHETILKVHDILQDGSRLCIVTELLTGGSLADSLDAYAGRPWEAAELVRKLAEALHYAHLRGVVHRDVKPRNILLGPHGEPRLADFGLAVTEYEQLAEARGAIGTPAYMPPEAARGDSRYAEPRSDIYSLGVVFYQLLTQRLPYVAQTAEDWLRQALEREPRPPRTIDEHIPPELEHIVLKCLAKNVADRYTTAGDLAAAIVGAARGRMRSEPISSSLPSWLPRVVVALVFGAVIAGGIFAYRTFSDREPTPRPLALVAPDEPPAEVAPPAPTGPEFDRATAAPNLWLTALGQSPPVLLELNRERHASLTHNVRAGTLQVVSSGWTLLELGQTDEPRLEVQAVLSQPAWEGGLGVFFGYHDSAEFGPAVKRLQCVRLQRTDGDGLHRLQAYASFLEVDELGGVRRRHDAPLGEPMLLPSRPLRLEVRVAEGRAAVRWSANSAWIASDRPLRWVQAEDFTGKFGIYVQEASGLLSNLRVKFPSSE